MHHFRLPLLLVLPILFLASACSKKAELLDTRTAAEYVSAYTSGVISKQEAVRVQFTAPVIAEETVGQSVDSDVYEIAPAKRGNWTWQDRQTLQFVPEGGFDAGQTYEVTLRLDRLLSDWSQASNAFQFRFAVREQFFEVALEGLYYEEGAELESPVIRGAVFTADVADQEAVESMLRAQQDGRALPVQWEHSGGGMVHQYTIASISRSSNPEAVELSWSGEAIGVARSEMNSIRPVSLDSFTVMDVEQRRGADSYLAVRFSDPLLPQQNLAGLIQVEGVEETPRFVVEQNLARVYLPNMEPGTYRVRIAEGVQNVQRKKLDRPATWSVEIANAEPKVRLAGNGVILPEGEGLYFPFEAIGLRAVEVEVFKIFNNNILQYLQSNGLDGDYELRRVGRIVVRETVPLSQLSANADFSQWTRYALDLDQLVESDPEAIYQIRIGFRPNQTVFGCANTEAMNASAQREKPLQLGFADEWSFMDNYYGIGGYYAGYDWDDRDNPCKLAYYNTERFVQRNVVASNLGLMAKRFSDRRTLLVVTDLRTAKPVAGANLQIYDYQQQMLAEVSTDAQGIAVVETEHRPFIVVANAGQERGYLRLEEGGSLPLSRFDVEGNRPRYGLKGFLYGERGVWRPGDSVFLNFILEDRNEQLPEDYPITFTLEDARGQLRVQRTARPAAGNVYDLHFQTEAEDPTGYWLARVEVGGATFEKQLRIETVRPNRLKIDLDFGGEALYATGGDAQVQLSAQWLTGASAGGLKARVESSFQRDASGFERFSKYRFFDPARRLEGDGGVLFDGQLDASGTARFEVKLPEQQPAPGKMQVRFNTRVFEPGGAFSVDNQRISFYPYDTYAGMLIPTDRYGEKRIDLENGGQIQLAAVDQAGNPLSGRNLSIGIYRVEWRWWWDDGFDNIAQYNSARHLNAEKRGTARTDGNGEAAYNVQVSDWGRYLVRVCDTESGHCSGDFFYAGYPWYDNDTDARTQASILRFQTDKETYAPGEMVKITLPAPEAGQALISLENGTEVLSSRWVETTAGENVIEIEATTDMTPNVYANVTLLQPYSQTQNDLPLRMYGVVPIRVVDPATRLEPEIQTADVWRPETEVSVEVRETSGKAMNYTLAIVDEGLLGLTRFQVPDPWETFYAREALGVETWDLYDEVLGSLGGRLDRVLTVGGDGAAVVNPEAERANRFEPVVRHLGPFELGAKKTARHTIRLPNYVGAVRVMVVASGNRAYGAAEKSVPVRKPLMVLATLPRVLGPGEALQLPVNVFAMEDKVRNVSVSVREESNSAQFTDGTSQQLSFSRVGDQLINFPLQLGSRTGIARFTVEAQGGGESASQTIEIQVRNPNPVETRTDTYILEPGQQVALPFEPFGTEGTRAATLEVAALPAIRSAELIRYLLSYPYGCLEQTISGAFSQLYVDRLTPLEPDQEERAQRHIRQTLDRLPQFQLSNGGFAYWPGQDAEANAWVTSYTGHFLLEAEQRGYPLPPNMRRDFLEYQRTTARRWNPSVTLFGYTSRNQVLLDQAYRLYTLALAQQPDMSAMNQLREVQNLPTAAAWRLAAAYALTGKQEVAAELTQNRSTQVEAYSEMSYTYGSDLRDQAMILETLAAMNAEDREAEVALRLARRISDRSWLSTQEAAFSLLALGKYVGEQGAADRVRFRYRLSDGRQADAGSDRPIMNVALPTTATATGQEVILTNTTEQKLYATIVVSGQPQVGEETATSSNLGIQVNYLDLDGRSIDVNRIPQGTDFVAEVRLSNPGTLGMAYRELALRQIFPSGWEILNTPVESDSEQSRFDYRDIRDDRVHTFFGLGRASSATYRVRLNAAYQGRFYLPGQSCEAMYDQRIRATTNGRWVEVVGR